MSSFGESVSYQSSHNACPNNFQMCKVFITLKGDSLGITGLSYHAETQCTLGTQYEECWTRVDLCCLCWGFTRLLMLLMLLRRSEVCMLDRIQIWKLGNFSWNLIYFLLECDADVKIIIIIKKLTMRETCTILAGLYKKIWGILKH